MNSSWGIEKPLLALWPVLWLAFRFEFVKDLAREIPGNIRGWVNR